MPRITRWAMVYWRLEERTVRARDALGLLSLRGYGAFVLPGLRGLGRGYPRVP